MRSKSKLLLRSGIALAVFTTAWWLGARSPAPSEASGSAHSANAALQSPDSSTEREQAGRGSSTRKRTSSTSESPEARAKRISGLKQKIKALWATTPENAINWELDRVTHQMLAEMEADELSAFFLELPTAGGLPSLIMLRFQVLNAWAVKDGPAAVMNCSVGHPRDAYNRARAMNAWAAADPEGALAWLRSDALSPEQAEMRKILRSNVLYDLAESDFARVTRELPLLDPKEREDILSTMVLITTNKKGEIDELLKIARESTPEGQASTAEVKLLERLARLDPQAALEKIETATNLDAAERKRLDLTVLDAQAAKAPVAAFEAWFQRNPDMEEIPTDARRTLNSALSQHAGETTEWLESMPASQLRDDLYEQSVRAFAEGRRYDEALRFSQGISDQAVRADSLRALHTFWKTADAAAAGKWVQSLPAADRALFGD